MAGIGAPFPRRRRGADHIRARPPLSATTALEPARRRGNVRGMTDLASAPAPAFAPLPVLLGESGRERLVGVEIEFTGLGPGVAARALASALGGRVERLDPHAYEVRGSRLGDLEVELDVRYAHPEAHRDTLPIRLTPRAGAWLGWALRPLVPCELVAPPLPLSRLPEIDDAVAALRSTGARGRGANRLGSLGLHFNLDLPTLDARTVAAYLKAYLLLEPALREEVAATGRCAAKALPPPFPAAYARRVLAPDYWPRDLAELGEDYLAANPTRDRGLDLLPILLHADPARVRGRLPYAKIGSRPILHYRLPQAHVGEAGWSIGPAWAGWAAVERLAAERARLDALGSARLGQPDEPAPGRLGRWAWAGALPRWLPLA